MLNMPVRTDHLFSKHPNKEGQWKPLVSLLVQFDNESAIELTYDSNGLNDLITYLESVRKQLVVLEKPTQEAFDESGLKKAIGRAWSKEGKDIDKGLFDQVVSQVSEFLKG